MLIVATVALASVATLLVAVALLGAEGSILVLRAACVARSAASGAAASGAAASGAIASGAAF